MQNIVLDFGVHKNHDYFLFGLYGNFEERFSFLVRRTTSIENCTATGTSILCSLHHRFRKARVDNT